MYRFPRKQHQLYMYIYVLYILYTVYKMNINKCYSLASRPSTNMELQKQLTALVTWSDPVLTGYLWCFTFARCWYVHHLHQQPCFLFSLGFQVLPNEKNTTRPWRGEVTMKGTSSSSAAKNTVHDNLWLTFEPATKKTTHIWLTANLYSMIVTLWRIVSPSLTVRRVTLRI